MPTWFDIVLNGKTWLVRRNNVECGRYLTQAQAFSAAVGLARGMRAEGKEAQVRVVRESLSTDHFLSLH